jgi:hypothetical protein
MPVSVFAPSIARYGNGNGYGNGYGNGNGNPLVIVSSNLGSK